MRLLIQIMLYVSISSIFAQGIIIHKKDAVVWSQNQVIKGEVNGNFSAEGKLYLNQDEIIFQIEDDEFFVPIKLLEKENKIFIGIDSAGFKVYSDTINLSLGYELLPEAIITPVVNGRDVKITASIVENPKNLSLTFEWFEDKSNPEMLNISFQDSIANLTFPENPKQGEYYFRLLIKTEENDSVSFGTFITVNSNSLIPFNIKTDYAAWIDSAVIYEVTPYIFTKGNQFLQITKKLPEIRKMGINTLWIQPVMKTRYGGQGYDITNYFEIRDDLGTEEELILLIQKAKSLGMKVLFDIVQNHTSIQHPYAIDAATYGDFSHYYDFYQREDDDAPYSQHYNFTSKGFIYYFWSDLVNLNYQNHEVQRWMIEAVKYWIKKYDIDGYRFDAIWGVNARSPQFAKDMRISLKSMKPEVMLLAEDKSTWSETFDERFDVGFDWAPSESWVSEWSFQTFYSNNSNPTIFNSSNQNNRTSQLRNALTNDGNGFPSNSKILRFIGNNDIYHFITHHGIERTKMAATLIFSLNGIPLVYNGQEIGANGHPYETESLFLPGFSIESQDNYGLFKLYKRLAEIRVKSPALYSENFREIFVSPNSYTFGFRRWNNDENLICLINMGDKKIDLNIELPVDEINLDSTATYYLTDLINGEYFQSDFNGLKNISIPIEKYTTRLFHFADSIASVVSVQNSRNEIAPKEFSISQNYPNPFNPSTLIKYSLPEAGNVKIKLFDVIGREVELLSDKFENAGTHYIEFSGKDYTSGVYFYRIEYQNNFITKKMVLIK